MSASHASAAALKLPLESLEQHRSFLEQVVRRVCGEQDATDIVQDVFVSACRSYAGFQGTSTLRTWLYRIAINRAISVVEARTRRERLVHEASCIAEHAASCPFEDAVAADSERRVRNAMRTMPKPWRDTVRARVVSGMTLATIARRDGVSVGTAHRRERLAKERIARKLGLA